jgi:N-acetylmuramoyl-L-alanine amidase
VVARRTLTRVTGPTDRSRIVIDAGHGVRIQESVVGSQ